MSRRSTIATAVATATVLVGGGLVAGQSGASAGTLGTLTIKESVASFATHDLGTKGVSTGDRFAFKTLLKSSTGKKLGVGGADCMRVSGTSDTKGVLNCVETFRLPGGDVVAAGLYDLADKTNSWGIVAGTGRYRGASGQIDFVTVNESTFVDTFRFGR